MRRGTVKTDSMHGTLHELPPSGHTPPCPGSIIARRSGIGRGLLLAQGLAAAGCDEGGSTAANPAAEALSAFTDTGYKSAAVRTCYVDTISQRLDPADAQFHLGAWRHRDIRGLSDADAAAAPGIGRAQCHERRQILWQRVVDDLSHCGGGTGSRSPSTAH